LAKVLASDLTNISSHPKLYNYVLLFFICIIPNFDPAEFHRLIIARTAYRIRNSMLGVGIVSLMLYGIIAVMATVAAVNSTGLHGDEVMIYTINNYVPKGIAIAGFIAIIAAVMSTIDSYLNSASVIIVHDVIEPIFGNYSLPSRKVKASRICTLIIAAFGCYLALNSTSIMELGFKALDTWHPVIIVPMLACIFNIKTSFKVVIKATLAALLMFVIWDYYELKATTQIIATVPCMVVNVFAFFTFRYLESKASNYQQLELKLKHLSARAGAIDHNETGEDDLMVQLRDSERHAAKIVAQLNKLTEVNKTIETS
ncbi:MAG: hypothetical protein AAF153_02005, partial [Pseudomonadota bacterium]